MLVYIEKITARRIYFSTATKVGFDIERMDGVLICENTAFLCNNCNCLSTFFSYIVKV